MNKETEINLESQVVITTINKNLKSIDNVLLNTDSYKESNRLFKLYLDKFKDDALKKFETSMLKPFIIYRVNAYYHNLINS